jgi:hypothetical protein
MVYQYLTSPTMDRVPDLLDFVSAKTGRTSPGTSARLANFFVDNLGDDEFLQHTAVVAQAQEGLSPELLLNADYLPASMRIPVFSAAFVAATRTELEQDLRFYRCVVRCRGQEYDDFWVAQVKTVLPLIDETRSQFRQLAGGGDRPLLTQPAFHEEYANRFLVARDAVYRTLVCSPSLVKLVQSHKLRVRFTATG